MTRKPKILLLGGGGHCKSCIDVIEQENKYEHCIGVLDSQEFVGTNNIGLYIYWDG